MAFPFSFLNKLTNNYRNGLKQAFICFLSLLKKIQKFHSGLDWQNKNKKINTYKLIGKNGLIKTSNNKKDKKAFQELILLKCKVKI